MQKKQPVALAREVGEGWGEGGRHACAVFAPSMNPEVKLRDSDFVFQATQVT